AAILSADNTASIGFTDSGPDVTGKPQAYVRQFRVNAAPVFMDNPTYSLAENSPAGTLIAFVGASDINLDHLTYTLVGDGPFALDPSSGRLTVKDSSALDFEGVRRFILTVRATDNGNPAMSTLGTVTVNLTDVNEAPAIGDANLGVREASVNGTIVG